MYDSMASMNPGVGAASRTRRPSTPSPGTPLKRIPCRNAGSCSFVLRCDPSHLQIAHASLTLVTRVLSPWKKGLCDSALRVEVLRARPGPPAGGVAAGHQLADRAEV